MLSSFTSEYVYDLTVVSDVNDGYHLLLYCHTLFQQTEVNDSKVNDVKGDSPDSQKVTKLVTVIHIQ